MKFKRKSTYGRETPASFAISAQNSDAPSLPRNQNRTQPPIIPGMMGLGVWIVPPPPPLVVVVGGFEPFVGGPVMVVVDPESVGAAVRLTQT